MPFNSNLNKKTMQGKLQVYQYKGGEVHDVDHPSSGHGPSTRKYD